MTVIIGKVDKKSRSVVLACDSLVTRGYSVAGHINKIFQSGDFFIGCAGRMAIVQILKNYITLPKKEDLEKEGIIVDSKFISSRLVPVYKKVLMENNFMERNMAEMELIIAYQDKLFTIAADFTVFECEQASLGSGGSSAEASLELNNFNSDIDMKVMVAIKYATIKNRGCGMPAFLVNTKEKEFYIFDDNLELKKADETTLLSDIW